MNDGKMTDARDQVLTTFFSFLLFICSMRPSRRGSMNGPFLIDRDMFLALRYFRRARRTMSRPDCARRVRYPIAGLPHGVLGGMPVGDLPSPPPCGWSRGFMTTPRTDGRRPMWRARPALPMF